MRKMLLVSACVIAMSAGAYAQNQPAPGESSHGNVGPGASHPMSNTGKGVTTGSTATRRHKMVNPHHSSAHPSSKGNVGSGTSNNSGRY